MGNGNSGPSYIDPITVSSYDPPNIKKKDLVYISETFRGTRIYNTNKSSINLIMFIFIFLMILFIIYFYSIS
jgi:hypothetical protein